LVTSLKQRLLLSYLLQSTPQSAATLSTATISGTVLDTNEGIVPSAHATLETQRLTIFAENPANGGSPDDQKAIS
jgi:hypothetical protein